MRPAALPPLDHVVALSDDTGIIQHAVESIPNRSTGYCTDDVARAYIVALMRLRAVPGDETAARLASTYLSYLQDAQIDDGRFHNFMSYDRAWLDDVGTHDSVGRALWALGFGARYAPNDTWRRVSRTMLERGLAALEWLEYPRSQAYAMLGIAHAHAASPQPRDAAALRYLSDALIARFDENAGEGWAWFEDLMTYDNARLPQALIVAGRELGDGRTLEVGRTTLAFYESVIFEDGIFVPIGNEGWYPRNGTRARYAQQPLEAVAMVDVELDAFDATGDAAHLASAERALSWYYGVNSRGLALARGGGCLDGLGERGVNRNMGAESTLAFLAAAYAVAERRPQTLRAVR